MPRSAAALCERSEHVVQTPTRREARAVMTHISTTTAAVGTR
jgi:hypothetical protein